MTRKNSPLPKTPTEDQPEPEQKHVEETPFEAIASICSVLVIGLFILTFLAQNFVIPSGSMEKTLLVGDHLVVDRINLAPPSHWMPLTHYREPRRGDVVVFIKPGERDTDGKPVIMYLVKRLVGIPGDKIHLVNGTVILNGVAQDQPHAVPTTPMNHNDFLDEFPSVPPDTQPEATPEWDVEFPNHVVDGDLVVPPGKFFMMGDNRHRSLDSRFWGFVPRENIVGRPLFNYWSFITPDDQVDKTSMADNVAWMTHVVLHFISDTRWKRTFHLIR